MERKRVDHSEEEGGEKYDEELDYEYTQDEPPSSE